MIRTFVTKSSPTMLGTLYLQKVAGEPLRTRTILPACLVKYFGIDVKLSPPDEVYPSRFTAAKVPMMQWADGSVQEESIPIVLALVESVPNAGNLLGDQSLETKSLILSWMCKFNYDVMGAISPLFAMKVGRLPKSKTKYDESWAAVTKWAEYLDKYFSEHQYLVKDELTIADLYGCTFYLRGFEHFIDDAWRARYPHLMRWWCNVSRHDIFAGFFANIKMVDKFQPYL